MSTCLPGTVDQVTRAPLMRMLIAVTLTVLGLSACTFPKNTHLVRRAESVAVDGQRQAPLKSPRGELESRFDVDGAIVDVRVNGGRLVSTEVRLLFVAPVAERFNETDVGGALTVAVQLYSTQPWRHRLEVDGRLRDAAGAIHKPAVIGMRDGLCEAVPTAAVQPLPDPGLTAPASGRACLFLRYDLSPPIEARFSLALGDLSVQEPGAPARRHQLDVEIASVMTDRLNGH